MIISNKLKTIISVSAALFLYGLVSAGLTQAATYWASPQGSQYASCTEISRSSDPGKYGTFARAVACATNSGDKVFVKPGIYTTDTTIKNPSSGIVIQGTDSTAANWPVLKPSGSSVRGIHFNNTTTSNITVRYIKWDLSNVSSGHGCVTSSSDAFVSNFVLEDFECLGPAVGKTTDTAAAMAPSRNTSGWIFRRGKISRWNSADGNPGAHCFYWQGDNGLVEHVECTQVNGYGIQYYSSAASPDNNVFRYNRLHNFDLRGPVYVQSNSTGNQIYGNILYNFKSRAIQLRGTNTKVWNNTVYNYGGTGIRIECNSGCEVSNNIVYVPGGTPISGSAGTNISYNLTTDPLFVDLLKFNFKLQVNSPAIDKGITINTVTIDFDGIARPVGISYDIGAYEYSTNTVTPPSPPSNLKATGQ